jgi:anti-sigma regulatory factor (Ser/Thr protein kinase)
MGSLSVESLRQSSHQLFPVSQAGDVGAVRRAVAGFADRLRAGPGLADRAGQAATELATNLLHHALPGGWILARPLPPAAVEILAVDHGPGIDDVAAALSGRSAQRHGLGCGLSAAARVSSCFDIDTGKGRGTTVLAVVASADAGTAPRPPSRSWAGVSVGIDDACGDAWAVAEAGGGITVAVIDGIGHGAYASAAADAAVLALAEDPADLDGYLSRANAATRGTRGAVLAVCRLEPDRGDIRCLSVGNVGAGILLAGVQRTLIPCRGTVGTADVPPRAKITCHPWLPGATLVLWTDGLPSQVDLTRYAGLFTHAPAVAAAALHRDLRTGHDDATVVVVRNEAAP